MSTKNWWKTNTPIKDLIVADVFSTDDLENLNDDIWNAIKDRILRVKGVFKISKNELSPTISALLYKGFKTSTPVREIMKTLWDAPFPELYSEQKRKTIKSHFRSGGETICDCS